jgi:DNA polymerase-3 subunit delta'
VIDGSAVSPLLLLGPEGVGRKFSVLNAAREMFCTGDRTVDCQCAGCYQVKKGVHPDLYLMDGTLKDIGIDEVKELIEESRLYPSAASVRCMIIDGADRFTRSAANAFLKTLEEPPKTVRFFLLAEDRSKILPTIRSRCGMVRYGLLPPEFVSSIVQQHTDDEDKALVYARMGEGSVGRSLRYCKYGKLATRDQVLRFMRMMLNKDLLGAFSVIDSLERELELGLLFMGQILHDVLIVQLDPMRVINTDISSDLQEMVTRAPTHAWLSLSRKLGSLQHQYRFTSLNLGFQVKTILAETFV